MGKVSHNGRWYDLKTNPLSGGPSGPELLGWFLIFGQKLSLVL